MLGVAMAGALLLAMILVGRTVGVGRYLEAARAWAGPFGALAPAAFVYVAPAPIGVPGMPFTLLSPVLFGAWAGFMRFYAREILPRLGTRARAA